MRIETTLQGTGGSVHDERPSVVDAVHHALASRYRRFVLRDLAAHFHPLAVSDIADRAVAELCEAGGEDTFRTLRLSLRHEHLPLLEAVGLIQFVGGRVELTSDGLAVARLARACTAYLDGDDEFS